MLGENIKKGWAPKKIKERRTYLSPYSEASVVAAVILSLAGITEEIIFSTGHTSGKGVPSEAKAMKDSYTRIIESIRDASLARLKNDSSFSRIPTYDNVRLEEKSLNTSENAREVKKLLKSLEGNGNIPPNANVGLLVPSFHLKRADDRFREHGIQATPIATEDILEQVLPGIKDKFMDPYMVAQELKRESLIRKIEGLPLGTTATSLLSKITRRQ